MSKIIHDYDKPGYQPDVRCHKCGLHKNPEDIGVYQQFEVEGKERPNVVHKVWFDSEDCRTTWVNDNRSKVVRMIE